MKGHPNKNGGISLSAQNVLKSKTDQTLWCPLTENFFTRSPLKKRLRIEDLSDVYLWHSIQNHRATLTSTLASWFNITVSCFLTFRQKQSWSETFYLWHPLSLTFLYWDNPTEIKSCFSWATCAALLKSFGFPGWPFRLLKSALSQAETWKPFWGLRYTPVNVKHCIFKCPIKLPTINSPSHTQFFTHLFFRSVQYLVCSISSSLDLSCCCHCWFISSPVVSILHASPQLY